MYRVITLQTEEFLSGYDRTNLSKKWLYRRITDEHPEYLESATPKSIKRYLTIALRKNGWWETSKKKNWFVKGGLRDGDLAQID